MKSELKIIITLVPYQKIDRAGARRATRNKQKAAAAAKLTRHS
jgi:hypothetical protein